MTKTFDNIMSIKNVLKELEIMTDFIEVTELDSDTKVLIPCSIIFAVVDCDNFCFIRVDKILRRRKHSLYVSETFKEIKAKLRDLIL